MLKVEDKLRSFEEEIIKGVEDEADRKLSMSKSEITEFEDKGKTEIQREYDRIIQQMKRKSQVERRHMLSRANLDRQSSVLKKRKEIIDRAFQDIRSMAVEFTGKKEYTPFLLKSIDRCISQLGDKSVNIFVKHEDFENFKGKIDEHIESRRENGCIINVYETEDDIIGGCFAENENKTRRVDCTLAAALDESKPLIGMEFSNILESNMMQGR